MKPTGRIDILHNNVGILEVGGPVEASEESWDFVNNVNIKSIFLTCKYVLPQMEQQGGGAIVNISSIAGIRWLGVPYISYSTTKGAIRQFTQSNCHPVRETEHPRQQYSARFHEHTDGR